MRVVWFVVVIAVTGEPLVTLVVSEDSTVVRGYRDGSRRLMRR